MEDQWYRFCTALLKNEKALGIRNLPLEKEATNSMGTVNAQNGGLKKG